MADNLSVSITADTTDLRSKLAIAQADMRAYGQEVKATATTLRTASEDMRGGLLTSLGQSSAKFNEAKSAATGFKAALGETSSGYRAAAQGAEEVASAHGHMAGSAGVTREALVMLHETMMGNYKRLAGSTVVLAERTNLLHTAIQALSGPMGIAVGAAAALALGLVALAIHAVEAEHAIRDVTNAAALMGRSTADAAAGAERIRTGLQDAGMGRKDIDAINVAVAKMPGTTQQTREAFAALAPAIRAAMPNEDVEKSFGGIIQAANGGASAVKKYLEEIDGLNDANIKGLAAAEANNDKGAAQGILLTALTARLAGYNAELKRRQTIIDEQNAHSTGDFAPLTMQQYPVLSLPQSPLPQAQAEDPQQIKQTEAVVDGNKSATELEATQRKLTLSTEAWQAASGRVADAQKQLASASDAAGRAAAQAALIGAQADQQADANAMKHYQTQIDLHREQGDASWASAQRAALDDVLLKATASAKTTEQLEKAKAQATIQFWSDAGKQQNLTDGQRTQAHNAEVQARMQLQALEVRSAVSGAKESLHAQLSALTEQQAAQRDNYTAVMALEQQKLDLLKAAGSKYTADYNNELKRQEELARAHNLKLAADAMEAYRSDVAEQRSALGEKKSVLDEEVAAHQITKTQEIAQLAAFTEAQYAADLKVLEDFKTTYGQLPDVVRKVNEEIAQLTAKHNADIAASNRLAVQESEKEWQTFAAPVTNSFNSAVNGVLRGTQTIGQAARQMAGNVVMSFIQMALQSAEKWAVSQLAMTTATQTGQVAQTAATTAGAAARNTVEQTTGLTGFLTSIAHRIASWLGMETAQTAATTAGAATRTAVQASATTAGGAAAVAAGTASIGNSARQAAAGAYSAVAGIPYVGPVLAPAAAAVAFAGVMAFDTLASFDKGSMNLPSDMIAQVHKGEMIIPATQASGLRAQMAASGAVSSASGGSFGALAGLSPVAPSSPAGSIVGAASGGNTSNQVNAGGFNPTIHMNGNSTSPQDLSSVLSRSQKQFMSGLWNMQRNGNLRVPNWSTP